MADELLDVLDKSSKATGIKRTTKEVHKKGLWHSCVHVWFYNSAGQVLLQKRSLDKKVYPGLLDISSAGHVMAGESLLEAAARETYEELGVKIKVERLEPALVAKESFSDPKAGWYNNEFDFVYTYRYDGGLSGIRPNKKEVAYVTFLSLGRFEEELKNPKLRKKYTPHRYYPAIIKTIKHKLRETTF